ncbi:unnamed protein product [Euphydryas editha]|nr:unnamed protein product [Euphydryas editha]
MDRTKIIQLLQKRIPPLDGKQHKGQAGRIGIVGGSLEYTGAPYFAGIAALKVGADLVHIFCSKPAATVIKSYSPELIVHPLLDDFDAINNISPWLDRLHALVIGPGLGRDPKIFEVVTKLIELINEKQIPLIIDADGLFLITEKPELIKNFTSPVILTPNKIEFERLCSKVNGITTIKDLNKNVTILKKGETDEFYCFKTDLEWKLTDVGSGRRCGGQGDLLSGSIATFLHWTLSARNLNNYENKNISIDEKLLATSLSCFAASLLIRTCNAKAFQIKGRSMLATDMIEHIHEAFTELYGI